MSYTRTAVVLHWLIAVLVAAQLAFGLSLRDVPRKSPQRATYVNLHKSIGISILALVALRLAWRLAHRPPALPRSMKPVLRRAAAASHIGLYALLLGVPLAGYVASNFSKYGVNFFNAIKLPPWGPDNPAIYFVLNRTHVIAAWILGTLVVLHVAAAVYHAYRRDGIVARMSLRARVS